MAKKQPIKKSEARIIVYLGQVETHLKNVAAISRRLDIDYTYCLRILKNMRCKGWILEQKHENKTFYSVIIGKAPTGAAAELLASS